MRAVRPEFVHNCLMDVRFLIYVCISAAGAALIDVYNVSKLSK